VTPPHSDDETGVYLHGTSAAEQARLGIMNRILNEGSLREMA